LSFIQSVSRISYCKSYQSNSLKVGVMVGPVNQKNRLTFGGDPVPDKDSGSLFHFPHYCEIWILGDLLAFLIQSPADLHNTRRND